MITIRNAPSENRQSTSELVIFASGNINFDTYVFLSSDELSVILPSALPHAPITNSYSIRPAKKVHREVWYRSVEHLGEYDNHYDHDEQWVQDTPHISKKTSSIL